MVNIVNVRELPYVSSLHILTLYKYVDPSMAARSFDRTFILAPTPAGTPAANAGWPCVILSDMMVVRNWTNPELMLPSTNAGVTGSGVPDQPVAPALVSASE